MLYLVSEALNDSYLDENVDHFPLSGNESSALLLQHQDLPTAFAVSKNTSITDHGDRLLLPLPKGKSGQNRKKSCALSGTPFSRTKHSKKSLVLLSRPTRTSFRAAGYFGGNTSQITLYDTKLASSFVASSNSKVLTTCHPRSNSIPDNISDPNSARGVLRMASSLSRLRHRFPQWRSQWQHFHGASFRPARCWDWSTSRPSLQFEKSLIQIETISANLMESHRLCSPRNQFTCCLGVDPNLYTCYKGTSSWFPLVFVDIIITGSQTVIDDTVT